MKHIELQDAQSHLAEVVAELMPGDTLVLCDHQVPIAEIRAIAQTSEHPVFGFAKGEFTVPDSFFEPLPDDLLKAFSGE